MAVTTCSLRTGRRARIFEIRPRSRSATSDVHDPSGHTAEKIDEALGERLQPPDTEYMYLLAMTKCAWTSRR